MEYSNEKGFRKTFEGKNGILFRVFIGSEISIQKKTIWL